MCGIYGLLSSPAKSQSWPAESFFKDLALLLKIRPADPNFYDPASAVFLEEVRKSAYRFVQKEGFLQVLCDTSLRGRLEQARQALAEWVRNLEARAEQGGFSNQKEAERVNSLIVGGRDLAWQIENDILGNIAPVRDLLGGESGGEFPFDIWVHGWALNLVLNGINRLEVRGRDSAGLAVYVHFRDAGALNRFLERHQSDAQLSKELASRASLNAFADAAVVRPETSNRTLLFAYKVANEVGEMGDNVRGLRQAIARDRIFQKALREPELDIQILAHTRWASNGIVSIQNCHPVDSTIYAGDQPIPESRGSIVAVLNGDIDNYQDLYRQYVLDQGYQVEEGITTDAKIIPLVIGHHYRKTRNLEEAFHAAFQVFEGSMAIGVMAADRPGEFLFGQKGSGQGLYLGFAHDTTAIASEMYGLVELTQSYVKAEGERGGGGEIFKISRGDHRVEVAIVRDQETRPIPPERFRQAEITTRDINRGDFPRFLLKEISESVETVKKTIRGKFEIDSHGQVRFLLGPEVLDPKRLDDFKSGKIRKVVVIGQGTAAIAGDGIAALLRQTLRGSRQTLEVISMKATELSGHYLRDDMSDSLIIAVSQSGTTTDTNRTVDMAKARGAWIIGIVNRRNSDLVYKAHGVLYTSDGRDIEMSVASTKAFYAQNVAGYILALALAEALGAVSQETVRQELETLAHLPQAMIITLSLKEEVRALAEKHAPRRRYWAIVGSGAGKIAADEIRIKLSELCYKAIATDFTEDKKHIDLSSEPLAIVCASGIPKSTVSDVVKEVAIFKAHQSIPIVIADAGESRFDPYAAGIIKVPQYEGALNYLLATMVGHLFGFYSANAFERYASKLRVIRTGILQEFQEQASGAIAGGEHEAAAAELAGFSNELIDKIREFQSCLLDGSLDSCITPTTSVKLVALFQMILGRIPAEVLGKEFVSATSLFETMAKTLTTAINELTRPIDAIKHQAKTVTVGISRGEEVRPEGKLWSVFRTYKLNLQDLPESVKSFLTAFEPLVAQVEGTTLYRVENLDGVGRPRKDSTIQVAQKSGTTQRIYSRCEEKVPLSGTKWGVVRSRDLYLGYGQTDGRKILIVPVIGERSEGSLLIYHLELTTNKDRKERLRALMAHRPLFERLQIAITERSQAWDPALLDRVDNDTLFFENPERIAEEIVSQKLVG